jgi:hypothetical protein
MTNPFLARLAVVVLLLIGHLAAQAQAPAWQTVMAVAQSATAGNQSFVQASAPDGNGNFYLAGSFAGTVAFGTTRLTSVGAQDIFVAKWSPATNSFVWAQQAGGARSEYVGGIAVSGANVYITGGYQVSATFGSTTFPYPTGIFVGSRYMAYVAKLADAGPSASFVWAQWGGSTEDTGVGGIAVSGNSVYINGGFNFANTSSLPYPSTATFGSHTVATSGFASGFVAKLTDAGSSADFTWAVPSGGPGTNCTDLVASGTSIYITGRFSQSTATFGSISLRNADANASIISSDVFLAKLTDTGASPSFVWATRAGGPGYDSGSALALSGSSVYLAGTFATTLALATTTLTSLGGSDTFVAKYTDAGPSASGVWALGAGSTDSDDSNALLVQGSSVYLAGVFQGSSATFGGIAVASATTYNAFVARLADAGASAGYAWVQHVSSPYGAASCLALQGTTVYVGGVVMPVANFGSQRITGTSLVGFLASLRDPALPVAMPARLALLQLFPNPARNSTTVQLPARGQATTATLSLTDVAGRRVRSSRIAWLTSGLRHEFDLSGLPAGLYTLHLQYLEGWEVRRLAVE